MLNFELYNPVKIFFGKGEIAKIRRLIPPESKVLIVYGGSSIKKNGVYEKITKSLEGYKTVEFSGIEANPDYATCMKAVETARNEGIDFILAVGGGSVIDSAKFIAAAVCFENGDPWKILSEAAEIKKALPLGTVLTLAGTGSEMNSFAVISKRETGEKLPFSSMKVFPEFSILDPETTFSLPANQTANGVIDAFIHVMEQYMTYEVAAPLQNRQAEAILLTLIEEGRKILKKPDDYNTRANIMWCATQALNGNISAGVPQDWATHSIGHELTARFGLAHGESLAVIFPALLRSQQAEKQGKLLRYAKIVWDIKDCDKAKMADLAIKCTEAFFREMGLKTRLSEYGITLKDAFLIADDISARGWRLGEKSQIGKNEIIRILTLAE